MKQMLNRKVTLASALCASALLAAGCGGGGSSTDSTSTDVSDSDSTVASRGVITGFGSVYVNGVRYHTDDARFRIDDRNGKESDLKVGMIVTVLGFAGQGGEGTADMIIYDNELKGPVSAITTDPSNPSRKTLTILGQSVLVTADTTIDDDGGLSFDTIAVDDILEVSGYITDSGFTATHIELQDNSSKIEIKGYIENLTGTGFTIRGFPVSYDLGTTRLDDIKALNDGLFVEVKGQLDGLGTTLVASKIEGEDFDLGDDMDEAEIKGVITGYSAADNTFMLQGQKIDSSRAKLEPATLVLADGLTVEAEGYLSNGILVAHEIKQKGRKIEIQAALSGVDAIASTVSFNFNGVDVTLRVNSGTEIEDDNTGNDLILSDLSAGNFVELEAYAENSGVFNVTEIERTDPDEIQIEAPVEAFDEVASSVTLLGIDFDLSAASFEDRNDLSLSAGQFFAALVVGGEIKLKDKDSNGVIDRAELED